MTSFKKISEEMPWLQHYSEHVPNKVDIPKNTVQELFDHTAEEYANKIALIFYGKKISFRELKIDVDKFTNALQSIGLKRGDRLALYLFNSPQFIIAYLGALKAGVTVVPVSPVYTSVELKYQLDDSKTTSIICQDVLYENVLNTELDLDNIIVTGVGDYLPTIKRALGKTILRGFFSDMEIPSTSIIKQSGSYMFMNLLKEHEPFPEEVEVKPEDIATLPYTGGTTGMSKGVQISHYNLIAAETIISSFLYNLEEGNEVAVAFLPFYHIYGQVSIMLNSLLRGFTQLLFTNPDVDEILDTSESCKATIFYGVPTIFEVLNEHKKTERVDWERFKLILCAADTLQDKIVQDWENKTGTGVVEGYGLTETTAGVLVNPVNKPKAGSLGIPIPNVNVDVIDPDTLEFLPIGETGELIVKGPNVMQGYWERDKETEETIINVNGGKWLRTGDIVKCDQEGYFYFIDRTKDLIKYKGYSVFAREIEDALCAHPQVKSAGVFGVPDDKAGQLIKAIVVLNPESRGRVSEEDITNYCKERLAHYKIPKFIEFRGELPRTDVGKVSRRELREEEE